MKFCIHGHQESTCVRCNPEHRTETVPLPFAMLEQLVTHLENTSEVLANYYKLLVSKGIPEQLAGQLTMELQRTMFGAGNRS